MGVNAKFRTLNCICDQETNDPIIFLIHQGLQFIYGLTKVPNIFVDGEIKWFLIKHQVGEVMNGGQTLKLRLNPLRLHGN